MCGKCGHFTYNATWNDGIGRMLLGQLQLMVVFGHQRHGYALQEKPNHQHESYTIRREAFMNFSEFFLLFVSRRILKSKSRSLTSIRVGADGVAHIFIEQIIGDQRRYQQHKQECHENRLGNDPR